MESSNVLLLIIDSARAANTSLLGYHRDTTPVLAEFAEGATTYTEARAPSTWSLPSHVSIFTGYHVVEHGVVRKDQAITSGHSVWEKLSGEGYETGLFTDNHFVTQHATGLQAPFDHVDNLLHRTPPFRHGLDPFEYVGNYREFLGDIVTSSHRISSLLDAISVKTEAEGYYALLPNSLRLRPLSQVGVDAFLDWSKGVSGPWAAFVNLMDCHAPYTPLKEYDRWGTRSARKAQRHRHDCRPDELNELMDLYDGALHQVDSNLERLFDTLRERGELDDTLVVVTSDHGEAFGERSHLTGEHERFHGPGLTREEVLHVPLVVSYPNQRGGRMVNRPASVTYFPEAVAAVRDEDHDSDPFCDSGPIVASTIDEDLAEDSPHNRLTQGRIHTVYAVEDGDIVRVTAEGSSAVRLAFRDGVTEEIEADSTPVREEIERLADQSIKQTSDGFDEASPLVKRRLRQLGYTE